MDVAERPPENLASLIAGIDRSEHVDVVYEVVDGVLREATGGPFDDAPAWSSEQIAEHVVFCEPVLARGGVLLAPDDGAGVAHEPDDIHLVCELGAVATASAPP